MPFVCWRMLTSVCWRMLTYANFRMLTYADFHQTSRCSRCPFKESLLRISEYSEHSILQYAHTAHYFSYSNLSLWLSLCPFSEEKKKENNHLISNPCTATLLPSIQWFLIGLLIQHHTGCSPPSTSLLQCTEPFIPFLIFLSLHANNNDTTSKKGSIFYLDITMVHLIWVDKHMLTEVERE